MRHLASERAADAAAKEAARKAEAARMEKMLVGLQDRRGDAALSTQ